MSQSETGLDQPISLGKQLKKAREDRGVSLLVAAQTLKLPASVIESMESDQFDRLGASVYVRGHLSAYLRWLDLPQDMLGQLQLEAAPGPVLQPSMSPPRSKVWIDRYAMRAVYVVLTLSIIVPALWVATERSGIDAWRGGRSLDEVSAGPAAANSAAARIDDNLPLPLADQNAEQPAGATIVEPRDQQSDQQSDQPTPVVASMTPFASKSSEMPASAAPASSSAGWTFSFSGDSWVEIDGKQGRLEYGLLRAGDSRHFDADSLSRVALGNVHAVEVRFDGQPVALDDVTRANVARFTVSSDGEISGDPRGAAN